MAKTMKRFHPDLERGDAFLHNSPYHGCTHAADLSVLVPVLDSGGTHRFTVLAKAHQADIGNSKPTTYMADARDLYEEGALIFAATRIQKRHEMPTEIVPIGKMRIRSPEQWYGDLLALIGVFNSLGRDLPANSASASRVEVRLRENCVVGIPNATTSCSVATTNLADRVANAVHTAMTAIDEGLGMAESAAIEGPVGAAISGRDRRHWDRAYINQLALAGTAGGASPRSDGWPTLGNVCTAGMWTMDSVEIDELNYPLRVDERMLLPDSEGAGKYCGAPCCRVVYQPIGGAMRLHYACDGTINAAQGVNGGGNGGPARQWIRRSDRSTTALPGIGDLVIEPGERIIAHSTGGGGFGDPRFRAVEAVCADVRAGLISPERARAVYAVVCDERGEPAQEETAKLRRNYEERSSI